jgi:hypothetical protein
MAMAELVVSVRDVGLVVEILECMKEAYAVLKAHVRAEESGQMACYCGAVSTAYAALERAATLAGDGDGPAARP